MPQRMPVLLLAVMFIAVPAVAAEDAALPESVPVAPGGSGEAGMACTPPCGYINPLIDLDFPEKPPCGGGVAVRDERPTDCLPLPADGESITLDGKVRWYWELSEDGTYPDDPATDIVLSFGSTASNPDFLQISVEPAQFVITSADLVDPRYMKQEQGENGARVWYWYEQDITATITRDGVPTQHEQDRLDERDGIQSLFLKAKSNGSSDRFREAFGVEEFRLDAGTVERQEAPGLPFALLVGLLGALLVLRRR